MIRLTIAAIVVCGLAACSGRETTPTGLEAEFGHTVKHYSDLCHFDFTDEPFPAGKLSSTHQWARDRYSSGLTIRWDIRAREIRNSPVMRQALNLVADTLYAMVLPSKGISTLEVSVDVGDLSDGAYGWTVAQGGGDFWVSGTQRGLPVSGRVGITIDDYELEDIYRKPIYISSLGHWYTIILHEALHVLGFGTSTKWEEMIATRRRDTFVCGKETNRRGHWSILSHEGIGWPLMLPSIREYRARIVPETICALQNIGWNIRGKGEGVIQPQPQPQPDPTPDPQPQPPPQPPPQPQPQPDPEPDPPPPEPEPDPGTPGPQPDQVFARRASSGEQYCFEYGIFDGIETFRDCDGDLYLNPDGSGVSYIDTGSWRFTWTGSRINKGFKPD